MDWLMFLCKFTCSLFLFLIEDGVMGSGAPHHSIQPVTAPWVILFYCISTEWIFVYFPTKVRVFSVLSDIVLIQQAKAKV